MIGKKLIIQGQVMIRAGWERNCRPVMSSGARWGPLLERRGDGAYGEATFFKALDLTIGQPGNQLAILWFFLCWGPVIWSQVKEKEPEMIRTEKKPEPAAIKQKGFGTYETCPNTEGGTGSGCPDGGKIGTLTYCQTEPEPDFS